MTENRPNDPDIIEFRKRADEIIETLQQDAYRYADEMHKLTQEAMTGNAVPVRLYCLFAQHWGPADLVERVKAVKSKK